MHDDDDDLAPYRFRGRDDGAGAFGDDADPSDLIDQATSIDVIQCPHCKKYCHSEALRCPRCKMYIIHSPHDHKPGWYVLTVVLALLIIMLFWVLLGHVPSLLISHKIVCRLLPEAPGLQSPSFLICVDHPREEITCRRVLIQTGY